MLGRACLCWVGALCTFGRTFIWVRRFYLRCGVDLLRKMPAGTPALLYCEDSMTTGFLRWGGLRWRLVGAAALAGILLFGCGFTVTGSR